MHRMIYIHTLEPLGADLHVYGTRTIQLQQISVMDV